MKPATMKGLAIILFMIYFPSIVVNEQCRDCSITVQAGDVTCTKVKEFITCLESTLDTCSYDLLTTYTGNIQEKLEELKTPCIKDELSTCNCEKNGLSSYFDYEEDCSIALKTIICLRNTTDAGCTGPRAVAAAAYEKRIYAKCSETRNTTTCKCEIAHAKADVATDVDLCTAASSTKECLENIASPTEVGCDGTSTAADVITNFAQPLIDEYCKTVDVCDCQKAYTSATLTERAKRCTAANIAKECLENITSTTAVGCDGTSKAADLITNFVQPLIDKHCGAASLNGVGLTVGILVMLLEMTRWI